MNPKEKRIFLEMEQLARGREEQGYSKEEFLPEKGASTAWMGIPKRRQ